MDTATYNSIVSFIWGIADDCLRDVILPMTVIRRLDAVLEATKDDVLKIKKMLNDNGIVNQTEALCNASKQSFCNASPFRLKDLTSRASQQKLKADFLAYLDGFSPNVQEILKKFKFAVQVDTMSEADILGAVIEKFVSPTINLSPYPALDDIGGIRLPALDNHTMGTVFEELIRRFNEENNEEAGEHFTPRDVVELMADLVFVPIADKMGGKKGILDTRFITKFAGDPEFTMIPHTSDGQLLFLLNNISKMKHDTELGSRIAEVHNGSSLFTGDAGQGESNARRYMIESDLVEAIIALPENMFYNTGIGTFIWVLSNRKTPERRGKIQLIDATSFKSPLKKNLGKRNCELTAADRKRILDLFLTMTENGHSRVFDNAEFGYWKVTVQNGAEKDTEQIQLTYPGGIDEFINNEVLPYAPEAKVDPKKTQIGYEISFTKYFYKPVEPRPLADITADILALKRETAGILAEVLA
jgi:type I restriction-modification system DNA methylase subunit